MSIISKVTCVLPAKNEARGLSLVLPELKKMACVERIIVVDDGSTDETAELARSFGAEVISHKYSKGNGAAIKAGARAAQSEVIVFMDGDGQHKPEDIPRLLEKLEEGFDLVVGARSMSSQASVGRGLANTFYNWFASKMVSQKIEDLTSGFRAVKRAKFLQFLYLLPNGFSYPTTSTMAFFRAGYSVAYMPIVALSREGKSHINLYKDGIRFLLIIFKIGTLYSPLKIFLPIAFLFFSLGFSYYGYTYFQDGRFTNMSALLFVTSVLVFLIGLVSEQITALQFMNSGNDESSS